MKTNMVEVVNSMNEMMKKEKIYDVETFVKEISEAYGVNVEDALFFYNELGIVHCAPKKKTYSQIEVNFIVKMVEVLSEYETKTSIYKLIAKVIGRGERGIGDRYNHFIKESNKEEKQKPIQLTDALHMEEGHLVHENPTLFSDETLEALKETAATTEGTPVDAMQKIGEQNERGIDRDKELLLEEIRRLKNSVREMQYAMKDLEFRADEATKYALISDKRNAVLANEIMNLTSSEKQKEKDTLVCDTDRVVIPLRAAK
ncbi:hypothetical protein CN918_25810 [Priestia megaterium]|nr:hypothetical protein CN918_25810 [Priestia megaterium]